MNKIKFSLSFLALVAGVALMPTIIFAQSGVFTKTLSRGASGADVVAAILALRA